MLESLPQTVYQALSFDQGSEPDYSLLANCFIKQGLLINNKGPQPIIKPVQEYLDMVSEHLNTGAILALSEHEISQHITVVGKVAQIYSEYQLTFRDHEREQTRFGVNLFQVIKQENQWKISSMCWDDRPDKSLLVTP